ncbi:MAG: protein kinase [Candidatus Micrarchaeota archaeon]
MKKKGEGPGEALPPEPANALKRAESPGMGRKHPAADILAEPPWKADSMVGRTLKGIYRVAERIGEGGMGTVYKATQTVSVGDQKGIEKLVAVKVVNRSETADQAVRERFVKEVRIVSKMDHPNIVNVTDFGETEDGRLFYVMEYLNGRDLYDISKKGPMEWGRLKPLMLQICDALLSAHTHEEDGKRRPIIHKDIKPENIFVVSTGGAEIAKLLDFGLAEMLVGEDDGGETGEVFGTAGYMPPEQAKGKLGSLDERADIYAIGAVMYHMLSGRPPVEYEGDKEGMEDNWREYVNRVCDESAPSLLSAGGEPGPPPEAIRIIMKCIKRDPSQRYGSVSELLEDIRNAPDGSDAPKRHDSRPRMPAGRQLPAQAAKKRKLARRLLVPAIVLAVAGTAAAGYFISRRQAPNVPAPQATHTRDFTPPPEPRPAPPPADSAPSEAAEAMITVAANVSGFEVWSEGRRLCRSGGRSCSFSLPRGGEPVELLVRRRGYMDYTSRVVPSGDRSVELRLQRAREPEKEPDIAPQPTLQPVPRLPRIEPNYGQEKGR